MICLVIRAHFTEEETEVWNGNAQDHTAKKGTEPGVGLHSQRGAVVVGGGSGFAFIISMISAEKGNCLLQGTSWNWALKTKENSV